MRNLLKIAFSMLLIQGCATGQYTANSRIRVLDKRNYIAVDAKTFEVEDKNLLITYSPDIVDAGVEVQFKNKSSKPIKIIWDETTYISPDNRSQKIFHAGVKITERANSQTPTLLPPMAIVDDTLMPTDGVEWDSNLGNWSYSPLCGTRSIYTWELDDKSCINQTFGFFVTYEIDNKKNSLFFKYKFVSKEPMAKK